MRDILLVGAALALAACETITPAPAPAPMPDAPPQIAGPAAVNDCDSLVPIDAADTGQGLARELAWLREAFPGATVTNQTDTECDGTPVDRVVFEAGGQTHVVLFDASRFHGIVDGADLDALLDG